LTGSRVVRDPEVMVWRIHFTAEDLDRIQVKPTLGPLAETVKALVLLRCKQPPRGGYRQWRSQVKDKLTPQMSALTALLPAGNPGVDLAMLTGPAPTMEQGVQALLAVPREQLLMEMEFTDRAQKLPAAAWAAAETGGQARLRLAAAAVAAHQVLVEPYWGGIHACLHAEHVARVRALAAGGPDGLLASLQNQWVRWRPPVLEVLVPADYDVPLNGRGIMLVPSMFAGQVAGLHTNPADPASAPWLVLPPADGRIAQRHPWSNSRPRGMALAALVGRNRAAVLRTISDGCTTTQLADRVGISLAAASQHASVLRDAGLITTYRQGSAVLHVITPLGAELLRAG
jgi:DNA-binding transcriptional ArsR family regulator